MKPPKKELARSIGMFTTPDGEEVQGELALDGLKSTLYLFDQEHFSIRCEPPACITGVLHDLTKVTLLDCLSSGTGSRSGTRGQNSFGNVFFHYALFGDRHLDPKAQVIRSVSFVLEDWVQLFYDFDAFGLVINHKLAGKLIEEAIKGHPRVDEIAVGKNPDIYYFTGKHEIIRVETEKGTFHADHSPTMSFPGPRGISVENRVVCTFDFLKPVTFDLCASEFFDIRNFLGLIAGRPQKLLSMAIDIKEDEKGPPEHLAVYWSHSPARKKFSHESIHPSDVLLDPIRSKQEFSDVLSRWLNTIDIHRMARGRFLSVFAKQRSYGVDRLIGAANMFDIYLEDGTNTKSDLSSATIEAIANTRVLFRALPPSPERDSVLGALGRIGKATLKRKVRQRAQIVTDHLGVGRLPDLDYVLDQAINCRNFYVHGGTPVFDYVEHSDIVNLFTDALEFVFASSDLLDCGWNMEKWRSKVGSTHFLKRYLQVHPLLLRRLNDVRKVRPLNQE